MESSEVSTGLVVVQSKHEDRPHTVILHYECPSGNRYGYVVRIMRPPRILLVGLVRQTKSVCRLPPPGGAGGRKEGRKEGSRDKAFIVSRGSPLQTETTRSSDGKVKNPSRTSCHAFGTLLFQRRIRRREETLRTHRTDEIVTMLLFWWCSADQHASPVPARHRRRHDWQRRTRASSVVHATKHIPK